MIGTYGLVGDRLTNGQEPGGLDGNTLGLF